MVRLKKNDSGRYIDRDTGKTVPPDIWKPIIERQRAYGSKSAKAKAPAAPKKYKPLPKKDGKGGYIDRRTGKALTKAEYMPIISKQRAYGNMSRNKRNINQSLETIEEDYGLSKAEVKTRYLRFVAACDRYGKDDKGRYKADFSEYMYDGKTDK